MAERLPAARDWTWGPLTLRFYPYKFALGVSFDWWPERYISGRVLVGPFMLIFWSQVGGVSFYRQAFYSDRPHWRDPDVEARQRRHRPPPPPDSRTNEAQR